MSKLRWISLLLLLWLPLGHVHAQAWHKQDGKLDAYTKKLYGKVIDYTANHGIDNRLWAPHMFQRRDMYVYLPPGYEPHQHYPLMIWLHSFCQDERVFLTHIVPVIDEAIRNGKLPPMIVAAPDGSLNGEPSPHCTGSFFMNSNQGYYADFILYDVFDFMVEHYPIHPERGAHILAGAGMGGGAAFNLAIKHREAFGVVMGLSPLVNLRWLNKSGRYDAPFEPRDWGWRMEVLHGQDIVAGPSLFHPKCVRYSHWIEPLFGSGPNAILCVAEENPIEMIDRYQVRPGDLEMYIGYSASDQLNAAAQVESFLYLTWWRGLKVGLGYEEKGGHDILTFKHLMKDALAWLTPRLAPFAPHPETDAGFLIGLEPAPVLVAHALPPVAEVEPFAPAYTVPACSTPCALPKRKLLNRSWSNQSPPACPNPECTDLSCYLPPMFLPDAK